MVRANPYALAPISHEHSQTSFDQESKRATHLSVNKDLVSRMLQRQPFSEVFVTGEKEQIAVWLLAMSRIPSRLMSLCIILVQKRKIYLHTVVSTDPGGKMDVLPWKMRQLLDQEAEKTHSCSS